MLLCASDEETSSINDNALAGDIVTPIEYHCQQVNPYCCHFENSLHQEQIGLCNLVGNSDVLDQELLRGVLQNLHVDLFREVITDLRRIR